MSALAINLNRSGRRENRLKHALLQPIDEWNWRRTILSATVIAVLVGALGVHAYRLSGTSGLDASRAALDEAKLRAARTKRMIQALPALRARAALPENAPVRWSVADALRAVSSLAEQNGLRVASVGPVDSVKGIPAQGTAPESERALKLRAEGTFVEVQRFLDALDGLPRLVVAENAQLKNQPTSLTFDATLRVFETLPSVPRATKPDVRDASIVDPFGKDGASGPASAGEMLLVGTLVGRERAMALIETAKGVDGFAAGQMIGDERIGRVHVRSIDLLRDDGSPTRSIAFAEDRS